MKKINKLFKKIKIFFKNIFYRKSNLLLAENNKEQEDTLSSIKDNEKQEFFEIYENFKKGIISLNDLMITDLIKVLAISQEELNIDDNKIDAIENELLKIDQEHNLLKIEKQRLNCDGDF